MKYKKTGELSAGRISAYRKESGRSVNVEVQETIEIPEDAEEDLLKDSDKFERIEEDNFEEELKEIDGIGEKTAKDITSVAEDEEELKEILEDGDKSPFRNDVMEKLREEY